MIAVFMIEVCVSQLFDQDRIVIANNVKRQL